MACPPPGESLRTPSSVACPPPGERLRIPGSPHSSSARGGRAGGGPAPQRPEPSRCLGNGACCGLAPTTAVPPPPRAGTRGKAAPREAGIAPADRTGPDRTGPDRAAPQRCTCRLLLLCPEPAAKRRRQPRGNCHRSPPRRTPRPCPPDVPPLPTADWLPPQIDGLHPLAPPTPRAAAPPRSANQGGMPPHPRAEAPPRRPLAPFPQSRRPPVPSLGSAEVGLGDDFCSHRNPNPFGRPKPRPCELRGPSCRRPGGPSAVPGGPWLGNRCGKRARMEKF
ncbi:proline-rich protein 2-like [Caloenas nicobarica]|uniref:proline-rich protein 2-like n=1 Tax=Caloenas nicobarica TaxID=187106 RepID=UPI0032B76849